MVAQFAGRQTRVLWDEKDLNILNKNIVKMMVSFFQKSFALVMCRPIPFNCWNCWMYLIGQLGVKVR